MNEINRDDFRADYTDVAFLFCLRSVSLIRYNLFSLVIGKPGPWKCPWTSSKKRKKRRTKLNTEDTKVGLVTSDKLRVVLSEVV